MYIDEWEWDDQNEGELVRHGLGPRQVREVAERAPRFRRNRRGRAASHMMIGPDRGGAITVVCIVAVGTAPGRWRAITGWLAEEQDKEWYRKNS